MGLMERMGLMILISSIGRILPIPPIVFIHGVTLSFAMGWLRAAPYALCPR